MTSTPAFTHVGYGEGTRIAIGGFTTVVKVPTVASGGSVSIVEHVLEPGLLGAPLHRHSREDETSLVMEGRLTVQVGDRVAEVGMGEYVVKPRGIFHAFWNAGTRPVRFVELISPGGFEGYFAELAAIIPGDGTPPDMTALVALATRYGMEFDLASIPTLIARHRLKLG